MAPSKAHRIRFLSFLSAVFTTQAVIFDALAQPPPPPAKPSVNAPRNDAPDQLATALAPEPGGLTTDEVARIAARTKQSVRSKRADLEAAQARVDQALVGYFPRLTLTAQYMRLSNVENSLGGAIVGAQNEGLLHTGPCPGGMPGNCVLDSQNQPAGATAFSFPALNNSYSLSASLLVPISDYFLRITQAHSSAIHAEKGKRYELEAELLQVSADSKVVFLNWVRAKGQVVVAKQAVEASKAHKKDAQTAFDTGIVSKADVLRIEAQIAAAEQLQAEAEAFEAVAGEQLRTVIGAPPDKALKIGSDVMNEKVLDSNEPLTSLQTTALQKRLEVKALDETILSMKDAQSVTRAGYFPRLDGFADLQYANPNQRIFPSQDRWDLTWDVGLRLTWTVNDTFTAIGQNAEMKARISSVAEQRSALRDGLRLEVANAYSEGRRSAASIEAADRGLAAAEESLRVRRELFRNGKATSTDLLDAEAEVTRARLRRLDAHVGLLVAKARIDHATGRDAKEPAPTR